MNPRTDFYRHRRAVPQILLLDKLTIPVAELTHVCEPQDNEDDLLVFETRARYGPEDGSHAPLPLKDWCVKPQLCTWFDIVLLQDLHVEFLTWKSPTPGHIDERLQQLQWRYGKEPMLPDLLDYLLGEMQQVLECEELEYRFEKIRSKLREYWERLHKDWQHAQMTWPRQIVLPVANFGGTRGKHHPLNGLR